MPNPQGNPEFKSKYGEKTKVIRLPESIADALALLLSQGCASSDILESLQPMTQQKLSDLAETDSTLVHLPVELRLLRAIKDIAKQEQTHYLQWIVDQCKTGLNLSPSLSPTSPTLSSEQLTALIDQRFDNLVTNLLDSLQTQLAAFDSRLTQLEHQPLLPINPPASSTATTASAIASPTPDPDPKPKPTTSQPTKSTKPTSQQQTPSTDKAQQPSDSTPTSPIKLPSNFPSHGLASLDLAKLLHRHQATINAHRRRGNGLLSGWQHQKVKGLSGWRYFPTSPLALKLWKDAIKNGLLKPANAANG